MPPDETTQGPQHPRWLPAVISLLPFALLFMAFAAGIVVPLWVYLLVLAWCL